MIGQSRGGVRPPAGYSYCRLGGVVPPGGWLVLQASRMLAPLPLRLLSNAASAHCPSPNGHARARATQHRRRARSPMPVCHAPPRQPRQKSAAEIRKAATNGQADAASTLARQTCRLEPVRPARAHGGSPADRVLVPPRRTSHRLCLVSAWSGAPARPAAARHSPSPSAATTPPHTPDHHQDPSFA